MRGDAGGEFLNAVLGAGLAHIGGGEVKLIEGDALHGRHGRLLWLGLMRERKNKKGRARLRPFGLVFARQVDRVVGEPEGDSVRRKVGERDRLLENRVSLPSSQVEHRRPVCSVDLEFPDLKFLGGHGLFASAAPRRFRRAASKRRPDRRRISRRR